MFQCPDKCVGHFMTTHQSISYGAHETFILHTKVSHQWRFQFRVYNVDLAAWNMAATSSFQRQCVGWWRTGMSAGCPMKCDLDLMLDFFNAKSQNKRGRRLACRCYCIGLLNWRETYSDLLPDSWAAQKQGGWIKNISTPSIYSDCSREGGRLEGGMDGLFYQYWCLG